MEEEFVKLDLSSTSFISEPRPVITKKRDPVQQAVLNPLVLEAVFKNLGSDHLWKCREVCSIWSAVAKSFLPLDPPLSIYKLQEIGPKEDFYFGDEISYDRISIAHPPFSRHPFRQLVEQSLSEIEIRGLDRMSHVICHMKVRMHYDDYDRWAVPNRLTFVNAVNRASNLRVLDFWHPRQHYRESVTRSDFLITPDELAGNVMLKETLESLSIMDIQRNDIRTLRTMNLKLKNLCLGLFKGVPSDVTSVLSLWLEDLSSSLECLSLSVVDLEYEARHVLTLEFPMEMNKLKMLHIEHPAMFGIEDIIRLLKQLPNLESLRLINAKSTGMKQVDYRVKSFGEFTHPSLKKLKLDTREFAEGDCPPYVYVPKLFPNLRKLSIAVYSRNTLLTCMQTLKDMMIEELELTLRTLPRPRSIPRTRPKPRPKSKITTWAPKVSLFNDWKNLRKLTLNGKPSLDIIKYNEPEEHCSMTKIYNIPMENILPKSLTSLEFHNLVVLGDFRKVVFGFLINLLQELPLVMDFNLSYCYTYDGQQRRRIERSELTEKIEMDPLTHPLLRLRFDL